MPITGLSFLLFALAAVVLYYLFPKRLRQYVLLAASILFYLTYGVRMAGYLAATILLTYLFGLWLDRLAAFRPAAETKEERKRQKRANDRKKRRVLALSLVLNFASLALLKYGGFLAAAVGFSMVLLLNDNEKLTFDLSPFFLALVAFCFSMTIGVLWEFFEFGMDWFFHSDMQRDTVINAIYSASLDPTRSNKVVAVKGIYDVVINGEELGMGGYLDIGLIDTMKDLLVNFVGAVVFSVAGYFYARSKGKKRAAALNFVPSKKNEDHDYLQQARESGPDFPEKRKK